MFSSDTYIARRTQLCEQIPSGGVVLMLGNKESSINYPNNTYHFRQDSTFLYLFGIQHPDLIGTIDIESGESMLFGDDLSIDDIIWTGPQPTVSELAAQVGVTKTAALSCVKSKIELAIQQGRRVHILNPYRAENREVLSDLLGVSSCAISNYVSEELSKAVVALRAIKSDDEIAEIERACATGYLMHTTAMKLCRAGVVEREIAGAIEGIALQNGAGTSFTSIVSQHGETLHNHCYDGVLEDGRLLLVDAGAETAMNYCSDFTRTVPVSGKFTQKQSEIYNLVVAANEKAFEISKPGVLYRDVHIAASEVLLDGLMALGLVKGDKAEALAKGVHSLFMPHGLGHMMGLDVHDMENIGEQYVGYDSETPRSTDLAAKACRMGRKLKSGMVVTVEPGLYFIPAYIEKWKAEGINKEFINFDKLKEYYDFGGIRIEDDMLITDGGNRLLGDQRVPKSVAEVEAFMQMSREK